MRNFKLKLLASSLAALLSVTAPSSAVEISTRIIGGDDVERDYPWMVALYSSNAFICGGVVISNKWLATAAHCVYDDDDDDGNATAYDASYFSVVMGESDHYTSTTAAAEAGIDVYDIASITIHPSYDSSTYDYDIALLELDSPYYQPGPALATSDRFDSLEDGDLIINLGYGYTSTDDDASYDEIIPDLLQEADLPFVPTEDCYWDNYGYITDNMFCAGYTSTEINIDSCSGDSGGPMFREIDGEQTLVGLVSWGSSTCDQVPGVYTKVSALRSWILENIDGFQVVEEGTANYDSETDSFEPGLISVYHYGEDDEILEIGTLSFDDSDIDSSLTVTDGCSETSLYGSDEDCAIEFELAAETVSDDLYEATLQVMDEDSSDYNSYGLRFVAESDAESDSSEEDTDEATDDEEEVTDSEDSNDADETSDDEADTDDSSDTEETTESDDDTSQGSGGGPNKGVESSADDNTTAADENSTDGEDATETDQISDTEEEETEEESDSDLSDESSEEEASENTDCSFTFSIISEWTSGYIGQVSVENNSDSAVSSWAVTMTYTDGTVITNSWNTELSGGDEVYEAENAAWNGAISSGSSTTFGYQATKSVTTAEAPTLVGSCQ